jgi:hypothetical protein
MSTLILPAYKIRPKDIDEERARRPDASPYYAGKVKFSREDIASLKTGVLYKLSHNGRINLNPNWNEPIVLRGKGERVWMLVKLTKLKDMERWEMKLYASNYYYGSDAYYLEFEQGYFRPADQLMSVEEVNMEELPLYLGAEHVSKDFEKLLKGKCV